MTTTVKQNRANTLSVFKLLDYISTNWTNDGDVIPPSSAVDTISALRMNLGGLGLGQVDSGRVGSATKREPSKKISQKKERKKEKIGTKSGAGGSNFIHDVRMNHNIYIYIYYFGNNVLLDFSIYVTQRASAVKLFAAVDGMSVVLLLWGPARHMFFTWTYFFFTLTFYYKKHDICIKHWRLNHLLFCSPALPSSSVASFQCEVHS